MRLGIQPVKGQAGELLTSLLAASLNRFPSLEPWCVSSLKLPRREARSPLWRSMQGRVRQAVCRHAEADGDRYRTVVLPSRARMAVDITGTLGDLYFEARPYEPATTDFILTHLGPGEVFVDIGANAGYYALLAAGVVGAGGKVYAFEPNPELHDGFLRSVRENAFEDRIVFSPAALSDKDDEAVDFFVSLNRSNNGLSSLTPWEGHLVSGDLSYEHKIQVRTRSFDNWARDSALGRVDAIKIDVEGAEGLVLKGMARSLDLYRPRFIICETSLEGPVSEQLLNYGYAASALDLPTEGWGNILYTRRPA